MWKELAVIGHAELVAGQKGGDLHLRTQGVFTKGPPLLTALSRNAW
jgi:hypothetical protein